MRRIHSKNAFSLVHYFAKCCVWVFFQCCYVIIKLPGFLSIVTVLGSFVWIIFSDVSILYCSIMQGLVFLICFLNILFFVPTYFKMLLVGQSFWNARCSFLDTKPYGAYVMVQWSIKISDKFLTCVADVLIGTGSLVVFSPRSNRNS